MDLKMWNSVVFVMKIIFIDAEEKTKLDSVWTSETIDREKSIKETSSTLFSHELNGASLVDTLLEEASCSHTFIRRKNTTSAICKRIVIFFPLCILHFLSHSHHYRRFFPFFSSVSVCVSCTFFTFSFCTYVYAKQSATNQTSAAAALRLRWSYIPTPVESTSRPERERDTETTRWKCMMPHYNSKQSVRERFQRKTSSYSFSVHIYIKRIYLRQQPKSTASTSDGLFLFDVVCVFVNARTYISHEKFIFIAVQRVVNISVADNGYRWNL